MRVMLQEGRTLRASGEAFQQMERTKWVTLCGATLAVVSSTVLYINIILWAVFFDTFVSNSWLNPFVFMTPMDSILNDIGMLLVSGLCSSLVSGTMGQSSAVSPGDSVQSMKRMLPASVQLARSQLETLGSIPNAKEFVPPQQQPCCARLKLAAHVLEQELFDEVDEGPRVMKESLAAVIDEEFATAAGLFFARCVEDAKRFEREMRAQYHEARRGHRLIYADVLEQIRLEPTFETLYARVEKLAQDCKDLGRAQEQRPCTVSGLLARGEKVGARYNGLMGTVSRKTGGRFLAAPRKGLIRIMEKLSLTAGEQHGKAERVCDVVRGAIECANFTTMMGVLRLLCDMDGSLSVTGETGGIEEKICLTRCKNRFGRPTSGGWADIMLNFYFEDDEDGFLCELQLVHTQLYTVRKNMGAHGTYAVFRAALELLEMLGKDPEAGMDEGEREGLVWKGRSGAVVLAERKRSMASEVWNVEAQSLHLKMNDLEEQNKILASNLIDLKAEEDEEQIKCNMTDLKAEKDAEVVDLKGQNNHLVLEVTTLKDEKDVEEHISFIKQEILISNKEKRMIELKNWLNQLN